MPYFQFYPKDWLSNAKVRIMSHEQRGMYFELLCYAWHQKPAGTLPNDDAVLAKLLNVSLKTWRENKPFVLGAFSIDDDGRLNQKRMRSEFESACQTHAARVEGGRKGGLSQAQGRLKLSSTQAGARLNHADADADADTEASLHTVQTNGAGHPSSKQAKHLLEISEASMEELQADHPRLDVRALYAVAAERCAKRHPKGGPMKLPFFREFLDREEQNLDPPGLIEARKHKAEVLKEAARDRTQSEQPLGPEEEEAMRKRIAEELRHFRKQEM
jgi:uncharacterized protein YdaU (DUF1376 family)